MIYRENWLLVKEYLKCRLEINRLSPASMRLEETWTRHVLEWMGNTPVWNAPKITLGLYDYLSKSEDHEPYSSIYMRKILSTAYRFFNWLVKHYPQYEKSITINWLDSLKPLRIVNDEKEHEFVTLEEIRNIAQAPVETLRDRRIRAASVFWFLSGIRVGAFVTLPIKAVNLAKREIYQFPSYGVHTKFHKKGTTHLLNIPDLLQVVQAWDTEIRHYVGEESYWFTPLSPDTGSFDSNIKQAGEFRSSRANKDLHDWCGRMGIPYHSPHKFRHGHAVYGIEQSEDVADLKAISQNLMHSNLSITDGVYGMLSVDAVGKRIEKISKSKLVAENTELSLANQLIELGEKMKSNIGWSKS
jgi:integrase